MKRFVLASPEAKQNCLDTIAALPEKPAMVVEIKAHKKSRTAEQNNALHGIIRAMADHCGYTVEEMKDYLLPKLGYSHYKEVMGELVEVRDRTSKMDVKTLSELTETVLAWAAVNEIPTL